MGGFWLIGCDDGTVLAAVGEEFAARFSRHVKTSQHGVHKEIGTSSEPGKDAGFENGVAGEDCAEKEDYQRSTEDRDEEILGLGAGPMPLELTAIAY